MKLNLLRSHDRYFATSKTQLWNVPTPTLAFVKHQGEEEEEGEGTAKKCRRAKNRDHCAWLLVCAKRKLLGNVRDDKSEDTQNANCIASGEKSLDKIDKKGKSLYAVQIQTSLMHPVTKQLKPQFWKLHFTAQTWIRTKRQSKESIKSENVIHFTFRCPMIKNKLRQWELAEGSWLLKSGWRRS